MVNIGTEHGRPGGSPRRKRSEIGESTRGRIIHLVVALGTGGTVSGAGRCLNERNACLVIEQAKRLLAAIVGNPLELADAYRVASAERTGVEEVVSFDRMNDRAGRFAGPEPA